MICKRITVQGFRNIESEEIRFSDGVNLLHGDNAQGKTNLLEAIYYISLGKSFRGATEKEMIGFGKEYAFLSLDFCDSIREQNISVTISRDKRRRFEQDKRLSEPQLFMQRHIEKMLKESSEWILSSYGLLEE